PPGGSGRSPRQGANRSSGPLAPGLRCTSWYRDAWQSSHQGSRWGGSSAPMLSGIIKPRERNLQPIDRMPPLWSPRRANRVLIAKQADLTDGARNRYCFGPIHRDKVLTLLGVIDELAMVVPVHQDVE